MVPPWTYGEGVRVQPGIRLSAGQVALIEPEEFGPLGWRHREPLTGTVAAEDAGEDVLTIDGVTPTSLVDGTEVTVSVFAPDALYRIRAGVRWVSAGRLAIDPIYDVERIQRRRWPRHELHLDVTLIAAGDAGEGDNAPEVRGRTVDIGMGGLRVETADPLPSGGGVKVVLMLPDGVPLVARATVVAADESDGYFQYRLAFDQLDDLDTTNLAALLDPHAAAADIRRKAAAGPPGGR